MARTYEIHVCPDGSHGGVSERCVCDHRDAESVIAYDQRDVDPLVETVKQFLASGPPSRSLAPLYEALAPFQETDTEGGGEKSEPAGSEVGKHRRADPLQADSIDAGRMEKSPAPSVSSVPASGPGASEVNSDGGSGESVDSGLAPNSSLRELQVRLREWAAVHRNREQGAALPAVPAWLLDEAADALSAQQEKLDRSSVKQGALDSLRARIEVAERERDEAQSDLQGIKGKGATE